MWKKKPVERGERYLLWCEVRTHLRINRHAPLAGPRHRRRYLRITVYALVPCSVLSVTSWWGRNRDVDFHFDASLMSTETTRRGKTDGLTSGALILPLF